MTGKQPPGRFFFFFQMFVKRRSMVRFCSMLSP